MRKKQKRSARTIPFVIGQDLRSDGHTRVTRGDAFMVNGGTEKSHEETVDIVSSFADRLGKEGRVTGPAIRQILRDILKRKGYTAIPREDPGAKEE